MTREELSALLRHPASRAMLVERLRVAALLLECEPLPLHPAEQLTLQFEVAFHLRELGQGLCDHARIRDGVCRFCEQRFETRRQEIPKP
jgi:hypothetical protein